MEFIKIDIVDMVDKEFSLYVEDIVDVNKIGDDVVDLIEFVR